MPPAVDTGKIEPIHVKVLALCVLVLLVEGVDLTLIPLLASRIATGWSVPDSSLGYLLAAGMAGLIVGGAGIGYLADRIGRRGALIAAMALMTVATFATAHSRNVPELLACRFVTGIAFGGVIPAAVSLVSEFLPARLRANVVALVILGQALGALLVSLLVKLPAAKAATWQSLVMVTAGACAVVMLTLIALLPESPRYLSLGRSSRAPVLDLFARSRALGTCLLWATFIGVGSTLSFFSTWLPKIYVNVGKTADAGADAMAAYSAGAIVGGLLLPWLGRLWHVNRVLLGTLIAGAASCVLMGSVLQMSGSINVLVAASCGVFVSGAFFLLYTPATRFYPTAMRSTGVGWGVAFGRFGNFFSPLIAGWMLTAGVGPKHVFWTLAGPFLFASLALYLFHRHTAHLAPAEG